MTTTSTLIPPWQIAIQRVRELRSQPQVSDSDLENLATWLMETDFNETSFLAGEAAALLISESAPDSVIDAMLSKTMEASGWHLYWRLMIQRESDPARHETIERCMASQISLIRQKGILFRRRRV